MLSRLALRSVLGSMGRSPLGRMLMSTAASTMAGLAALPALTRIASPAELATFLVVQSMLLALTPLSSLRLDVAIAGSSGRAEANLRAVVAAWASVAFGLAVLLGLIGARFLLDSGSSTRLWDAAMVLPVALVGTGLLLAVQQRLVFAGAFRSLAALRLQFAVVPATLVLLGAGLGFNATGMVAADAVGKWMALGVLLSRRDVGRIVTGCRRVAEGGRAVAHALRNAISYSGVATLSSAIGGIVGQSPSLASAWLFGPTVGASVGLAQRAASVPSAVLGRAVTPVFLHQVSHGASSAVRERMLNKYAIVLALVAAVLFGPLALAPIWFVVAVLGPDWSGPHMFLVPMALLGAAQLVSSPLSSVIFAASLQRAQLRWDMLRGTTVLVTVLIARLERWTPFAMVTGMATAIAVFYVWQFMLSRRAVMVLHASEGR